MPTEPRGAVAPLIEQLTRAIADVPGVRLAVLFGSTVKGTARPASDLDIGVSLEAGCDVPALGVVLERATGRRVDLIVLDAAPPLLRFEVARDAILLLERRPHEWAEFRAHAMIDWWDWAPTARIMHEAMAARLSEEADRGAS